MRVLVLDLGCMHGAFTAGALAGLEDMGITAGWFDAIIGSSAGGWNGAYFVTGQLQEEGLRLWSKHLPNGLIVRDGMRLRADMAYFENITRCREPLSVPLLRQSRTKLIITRVNIGGPALAAEYVCLNEAPDPVACLLAGSSMPILAPPFLLDGKFYRDGGLCDPIPIRYALEELRADEVWVILNSPRGYRYRRLQWWAISWLAASRGERKLLARTKEANQTLASIESNHDLKVIRPCAPLPVSWLHASEADMEEVIDLGRRTAVKWTRRFL